MTKGPTRRAPRQQRSRATVEFILSAAAIVIEQDGYRLATTERIARMAGVSIGSFYQYFSGKDALYGQLLERESEAFINDMDAVTIERSAGFEQNVRRLLEAPKARLLAQPHVFREFLLHVPGGKEKIDQVVKATSVQFRKLVEAFRPDIAEERAARMGFLLIVIIDAIGRHSSSLHQEEALMDEFVELMRRYILLED